jgi:hypothetical protein
MAMVDALRLPAGSTANTEKRCAASVAKVCVRLPEHGKLDPPSIRHRVTVPSGVVKDQDTVALAPGELGALVIDGAVGSVRSRMKELRANGPVFPCASVARTSSW